MKSPSRPGVELSWDDLRIVAMAAEAGSLSGVARELGVSVATVGRRLERLERLVGARLFHRHSAGLTALPEAGALIERAGDISERVDDFLRMAAAGAPRAEGVVTVSTLETVVTHVIAPRLPELRRRHPGIELVLRSTPRIARLDRSRADLAVRVVRPHESRVVGRKIGTMRFGLYATAAYLAARGRPCGPAPDLSTHDVVMYDQRWDTVPEMTWLTDRGARPVFRVTTANAVAGAVQSGAALGLVPTFLATEEMELLLGPDGLPVRHVWLVMHEDLRRAPHVRAVAEFLAGLFEDAPALRRTP